MSRRDPVEVSDVVSVVHDCRPPRWMMRAVVGLTAAVVASFVVLAFIATYVYQQQQYIQGRGEQRDRENAAINQRITDRICDLLALAPADSPQADYYRDQLDCPQPGLTADQLPPALQQQQPVVSAAAPSAAPSPVPPPPPLGSPAMPGVERPVPNVPPPAEPAPTPLVDLGPITGPVCDLAGVCG